jgi:hypothetical protein
MKRFLWAGALALPLLFLPSEAKAIVIGGCEVDTGAKVWCNVRQFNLTAPTAGPWYLYWPYQAHFQVPVPGVNPFFAAPMTMPPGFGQPPPMMAPAPGYRPPMPQVGQGYYQPAPPVAQGYQAPQFQNYYQPAMAPAAQGYQAPQPQGGPHPQVNSYFPR